MYEIAGSINGHKVTSAGAIFSVLFTTRILISGSPGDSPGEPDMSLVSPGRLIRTFTNRTAYLRRVAGWSAKLS